MISIEVIIIIICTFVIISVFFYTFFFIHKRMKNIEQLLEEFKTPLATIDNQLQSNLAEEKRTHILLMVYRMREAVAKQQEELRPHYIKELPTTHGLSADELSHLFPKEAALLIDQCWSKYQDYIDKHWLTKQNRMKTVFQGTQDNPTSERGQLHFESKKLVSYFDQIISKLNSLT